MHDTDHTDAASGRDLSEDVAAPPTVVNDIGQRIRELRQRARLTQQDLAAAARTHRSTLANIETGHQGTTVTSLVALARALGVPTGVLLGEVPMPSCATCGDTPPDGFTCNTCRRSADEPQRPPGPADNPPTVDRLGEAADARGTS